MADFHRVAKEAGIEVIAAESFIDNPTTQIENIKARRKFHKEFTHLHECTNEQIYHITSQGIRFVMVLGESMISVTIYSLLLSKECWSSHYIGCVL